jgi:hypothetical protein
MKIIALPQLAPLSDWLLMGLMLKTLKLQERPCLTSQDFGAQR